MVLPLPVDDLQHDHPLVEEGALGADQRLALGVALLRAGGERPDQLVAPDAAQLRPRQLEAEGLLQRALEALVLPHRRAVLLRAVAVDVPLDDLVDERQDVLAGVLALEDHAAHVVDGAALLVHHVVVLEQVLSDREVLRLDLLLRALDRLRHHPVLDRDALLHSEPQHEAADPFRPEDAHQVVLEREVEARGAGVALAAGAAAQLVVDAAGLVTLGPEDVQAPERHHALALVLVEQRLHGHELGRPDELLERRLERVDLEEVHRVLDLGIERLRDLLLRRPGEVAGDVEVPGEGRALGRERADGLHRRVVVGEGGHEAEVAPPELGALLRRGLPLLQLALELVRPLGRDLLERRRLVLRRRVLDVELALGEPVREDGLHAVVGHSAEDDVGAAAGHVRGDRHRAEAAGLGDDLGLALVVLRVEDDVLDPGLLEQRREVLGLLDRDRADEDRPARLVKVLDLLDDRLELLALGPVHDVRVLDPDERAVRRDDEDLELVDLVELGGLGLGGAGHARELRVHAEVVLEGDRREGLVLALDLDLLLRLDGLVQAVRPAPAGHEAARELVDDRDLPVLHHVVDVAVEEIVGPQALVHVVEHVHVGRVPQVLHPEEALAVGHAHLGEGDRLVLLVDDEVARLLELGPLLGLLVAGDARARLELRDDRVDPVVLVRRLLGGAADDERGPRLVDEDRVDLVHDREVVAPLDVHAEVELHVVAQVVEAELVVRPVRDVGRVGHLALAVVHAVLDDADREAEEPVEPAHPLGVPLGEVVVDRHDVNAVAGESVEVRGEGRDEGLALARLHLGDRPAVEGEAADELHVEVPHPQHPPARLADDREGLGQDVVERLALREPFLELGRLGGERVVVEGLHLRLEGPDGRDDRSDGLELALVLRSDDPREDGVDHVRGRLPGGHGRSSFPRGVRTWTRRSSVGPVIQQEYHLGTRGRGVRGRHPQSHGGSGGRSPPDQESQKQAPASSC